MRKLFFLIFVLFVLGGFLVLQKRNPTAGISNATIPSPSVTPFIERINTSSLFVPYWSLDKNNQTFDTYDQLIYFGISPTDSTINLEDAGYLQLKKFVSLVKPSQKTWLTLRMLDSTTNFTILKDKKRQERIIAQTMQIAKDNHFDGVVLDLELSALPFDSLLKQVNVFGESFATAAKKEELQVGMTVYGDTFYRIRPFEVKTLAKSMDQILIMAYDFHKARGNPGPNFPLNGQETYGYDYVKLTDNFLSVVPAEKIAVIFGLFGYDWPVDEKNVAQAIGKAKSVREMQTTIVDQCASLHCTIKRDGISSETMITYVDEGVKHTVWYEDMESVKAKQAYLKTRGITNFSYWAWSYF